MKLGVYIGIHRSAHDQSQRMYTPSLEKENQYYNVETVKGNRHVRRRTYLNISY